MIQMQIWKTVLMKNIHMQTQRTVFMGTIRIQIRSMLPDEVT